MANHEYPIDQIVDLTKEFIRIPSVTGEKEPIKEILDRTIAELKDFSYERFIGPKKGSESLLFFNTPTRPEEFRVILNGHLDVILAKPDQFNPYISDGKLFGRGSSDMKAGMAAEILVFKKIAKSLPYPIGLQIVTDEEIGGADGAKFQIKEGVRSKLVLSGEPTDLDINNEMKGVLVLNVTAIGKSAHASALQKGDNAVVKLSEFITKAVQAFPIPRHGEWKTTLNVGNCSSENPHNKVPDMATSVFDIRHIPEDTKDNLKNIINQLASEGIIIREDVDGAGIACSVDPTKPDLVLLANCIESITKKPVNFVKKAYSSDIRHFVEVGSTAANFGPSGEDFHEDGEYGVIESYQQYAKILSDFLKKIK
jgi:succinyl-diaminopimelate desuccinylase